MPEMNKEECVNGLKHMAAYKALSLDHIRQHGLRESSSLEKEQYVAAEESQLRVLITALFLITGEEFVPPTL